MLEGNDLLTQILKAAADPFRLQILRVLGHSSFGALELSYILGLKQNSLSHHLKKLSQAGLINNRREGNSLFYRRAVVSGAYADFIHSLYKACDTLLLSDRQQQAIQMVFHEKEQQSREFFDRHAEHFREQQELIASFDSYATLASDMLTADGTDKQLAIEIGPGTGEFLANLSRQYEQVIGVDISRDMLEQAGEFCSRQQLKNIELIHGDQTRLSAYKGQADAVVFNMVLHHVANPFNELKLASQLVKPGGALLVTELSQHDQDWAKNSCGDLWLGFDTEELNQWGSQCGLLLSQKNYVGLRNGFQVQCLIFSKPTRSVEEVINE